MFSRAVKKSAGLLTEDSRFQRKDGWNLPLFSFYKASKSLCLSLKLPPFSWLIASINSISGRFRATGSVFALLPAFDAFSNEEALLPGPTPLEKLFPFLLIGMFFYFLLIRPQQRRQKNQSDFLSKLKEGEEVLTSSGIYGKIVRIMGDYLLLEVDKNTQIRLLKSAVSSYAQEKKTEKEPKTEEKKTKKIKA